MASKQRSAGRLSSRTALLDAAERLMVDEGYAAATSRRVAAEAGVNAGLIHYYFGTMDDMFVELFRRAADRGLGIVVNAETEQPLWMLWESIRDFVDNALMTEFIALANHRPPIRAEIKEYSERLRRGLISALQGAMERDGSTSEAMSPAALSVLMVGVSRFLQMESAFGIDLGHDDAIGFIEAFIRSLEGDRKDL